MHHKRRLRGIPLDAAVHERLSPFEALVRSCIVLADADSEDDAAWYRAVENVRKAAVRWVLSIGYTKTSALDALAAEELRR
jgi:hypothetical protein